AAAGKIFFQVQDSGSTLGGGQNLDTSPNSLSVTVTAVNDEPAGTSRLGPTAINAGATGTSLLEDGSYTFNTSDFGFTDPLDVAPGGSPVQAGGDSLAAVKITT